MKNALGREIPTAVLPAGKEVYQGQHYHQNWTYTKHAPRVKGNPTPHESKLVSLKEAIINTGLKDGMTISFHHHFRNGDETMATVMAAIHELGIKDLYLCASSLGKAAKSLVPMIEDGTITRISSSGVRDEVGQAISSGKLKHPAIIRTHGGRVRAIETGEVKIDVAFIGAPCADAIGNASGVGGQSDCGVLSYAAVDAQYANHVVALTDTIVDTPNANVSIQAIDVDYVVQVDTVGDPDKIASGAIRLTKDARELGIAKRAAQVVAHTEWFKEGFSFQTGAGGSSLAVTRFLKDYMDEKQIKMSFALGGITEPMVNLLKAGYIRQILDTQDFDLPSVQSVHRTPGHVEISTSQYANPLNKGAYVNYLDYVILGALEVDTDFNVNVVQGSDGIIQGAPGGHPDTAQGANVTIIVAPLIRGRIPTVRSSCTSITTPGETVDVVVTDYGIAVNPNRPDIQQQLDQAGIATMSIEALRDIAYHIVGTPQAIAFTDQVVALVEYRDGTIIDTIRKVKEASE